MPDANCENVPAARRLTTEATIQLRCGCYHPRIACADPFVSILGSRGRPVRADVGGRFRLHRSTRLPSARFGSSTCSSPIGCASISEASAGQLIGAFRSKILADFRLRASPGVLQYPLNHPGSPNPPLTVTHVTGEVERASEAARRAGRGRPASARRAQLGEQRVRSVFPGHLVVQPAPAAGSGTDVHIPQAVAAVRRLGHGPVPDRAARSARSGPWLRRSAPRSSPPRVARPS